MYLREEKECRMPNDFSSVPEEIGSTERKAF
jgi:hypothetical protein